MDKKTIKAQLAKNFIGAVMRYVPDHFRYRYESLKTKAISGTISAEEETRISNSLVQDILKWCDMSPLSAEAENIKGQILMGDTNAVIDQFPPSYQRKWKSIKKLQATFEQELLDYLNEGKLED